MTTRVASGTATGRGDHRPAKQRITLIGAAVNVVLCLAKVVGGVIGQSQALVADGVHSLSDLVSDVLVLLAVRWGSSDADQDHPYGHARIETAATAVIGAFLLMVAGGFVVDAVSRLFHPERLGHPGWLALVLAAVSIAANEVLARYTLRVARATGSGLIAANAEHHRSDALSSVVVVVGVAGVMLGLPWLDAVAAIVVAGFVGHTGWSFIHPSFNELVDRGLSEEELRPLSAIIDSEPGVRGHHALRTRRMGGDVIMDVHVVLDRGLSLVEAHRIATGLEQRLLGEIDSLSDALVRVEPDRTPADRPD